MFMSFYSSAIDAESDEQLSWFLRRMEESIGVRGEIEKAIRSIPGIPVQGLSYWWKTQLAGINKVLSTHGKYGHVSIKGKAHWIDSGSWRSFDASLSRGPLITGTYKMGGLPGCHIVLVTGVDSKKGTYYLNDPYGNPLSNYRDRQGQDLEVPIDWFRIQCSGTAKSDSVRFIYWREM